MEKGYTIQIVINPVERAGGGQDGSELGGGYSPAQAEGGAQGGNSSQISANKRVKDNGAKAFARQLAGKVASTALNNYGNITGDYIAQQNMQTVVSETASLAAAAALGVWGLAAYGLNKAFEGYNYISQIKRSQAESAFRQKRVYAEAKKS